MCEKFQRRVSEQSLTEQRLHSPLGLEFFIVGLCSAVMLLCVPSIFAQTLKLGPFDLSITAQGEVGYDSNVDGIYPEEEVEERKMGDFYWMPGLTMRSQSVPMWPHATLNLAAAVAYQDYLYRNDLDTELYNAVLNFQITHTRLTLGGIASVDFSVDGVEDQYVPGSASRDPVLTRAANVFANWNYRKFRIMTSADYSIELHQFEEYQEGDQEETTLSAGAYWDLFTWGSLYYTWEKTMTTLIQSGNEDTDTTTEMGVTGAIPVDLLRHPKISYSLGFAYTENKTTSGEDEKTWEPVHTLTVQDELQLSKSIRFAGSATWESALADDELTFVYNLLLEQQLGPRAKHALTFTQEPESTFGSNSDTKTTAYGYSFSVKDLLIYNLALGTSATYEESTPLGAEDSLTEKTTTLNLNLSHTRQLTRKLSRVIAYDYKQEDSNFHHDGPNQKHLVTYRLVYAF